MLFSYCKAFNIDPYAAKDTPISFLKKMLLISGVATELEQEEYEKVKKQSKM
jgi:hypothetical protein|tara:strand:+ start:326 stop:481 length:156 start_codon:yes stop_codon:yes gene_type:complete